MPRLLALSLAALVLAVPAAAQVGLSVRASTLGAGADLSVAVAPTVNVRASANVFTYRHGGVLDEALTGVDGLTLDYDADLGLGSVGALVDWHPFGNTLRLTAGALYNLTGGAAEVRAAEPYYSADLDREFSVERVGTVRAEVSYDQPLAPYAGIGLGDLTAGLVGLSFEAGVAYVGPPSVEMHGTGLIGGTADPANVAALEAGLDSFRFHPVVSVGIKTAIGR